MVYYEQVIVKIHALGIAEVIIDLVICLYDLLNSIISNYGLVFILKLWLSLCYFLRIKRRLSITLNL